MHTKLHGSSCRCIFQIWTILGLFLAFFIPSQTSFIANCKKLVLFEQYFVRDYFHSSSTPAAEAVTPGKEQGEGNQRLAKHSKFFFIFIHKCTFMHLGERVLLNQVKAYAMQISALHVIKGLLIRPLHFCSLPGIPCATFISWSC